MKKSNMVDWKPSVLVLKLWLVLVPAIINFTNSKLAAAYDNHAKLELEANVSGFINIDCGASGNYTDGETDLFYESDAKYIDTGENHNISSNLADEVTHRQQRHTLRSFPEGKRNCYTLKPKQGGKTDYLIRAVFEYGNYDGKNQTPKFELYLGVNKWTIVDEEETSRPEIIHTPSTEYIDVCLVSTGQGVPYISALELRPLDSSIYQIPNGALQRVGLVDLGGIGFTRYPHDVYDRLWVPWNLGWTPITNESTIHYQSFDDAYKVPEQVLNTAASQPPNDTQPLLVLPYSDLQLYVYFHFAEFQKLEDGQKRKLRIDSLEGGLSLSDSVTVTLEYLKPLTIALNVTPNKGILLAIFIYAEDGNDIPPILNAFEIYEQLQLPFSPTNLDDVEAIKDIKRTYKVTRNWQGDPCVPSNFTWVGLQCSNDGIPRITSLNLSSSELTGEIPTSISNLQEMTLLDLSCNNLVGRIPESLAQLPNLKILNLTGNKLTGSVPAALLRKSKDGTLLLSLKGNPGLCLSGSCHKQNKFIIAILASILGVLLILLALFVLARYNRKRKREMATGSTERSPKSKHGPFTYLEIISITNNFKTVIGEGDFGKVYYGTLKDKTEVAVKVLSPTVRQGYKEFRAEAEHLMTVRNKNLVSLIGYCDDQANKVLIYEYMVKGNLRKHLSGTKTNALSWIDRLHIAIDAACGLDYLHNGCRPPIIHRDLKPSNILLTETMQAKIADFGLYTPRFLEPEFDANGISNKKSDIYSFGIILFELITGQPAIKEGLGNNKHNHILQRVKPEVESRNIQNVVDPRLQGEFNTIAAWKIVDTAMTCVWPTAAQRPDINNVLIELKESLAIEVASRRSRKSESRSNNSTSYLLKDTSLYASMEMVTSKR